MIDLSRPLLFSLGLAEETLIMFSSDNGPSYAGGADAEFFQSAGPLRGLKGSLYEGGIRVPLIARWPGKIQPRSQSDHISAFCDMLPTFAELAGAAPPDGVDGISIAPTLLASGDQPQHDALYWELRRQQAVRQGSWKAVRRFYKQQGWKIELFNLVDDEAEQNDLAEQHPHITQRMAQLMKSMRTDSGVARWEVFN